MSKKSPQLRFEGFTDDWEERRLSEVLRERNNQQPQSMEYPLVSFTVENGVTPKTDRYEREQLVVGDKSSKKYKVTVLNDIVYNPANLKFGAISRNKYGNAVFSPIYVTFLVNNDVTMPEFIEMLITRKDFIKRALKYQQGTVYERQSVSPENLLSMNLYLPGKLEQEKIGTFFKHLDDTISLQQCKLDLLKEQKKGYLQKMFPKNGEKVPELRFAGFADDWEERKLGEISKYSNGGSYENDVVENGTYELITLKSVNMSGKLVSSGKFINRETKTLEKDTLVMILSEQAPGLLGMTAQIPENNKYVLNQRVAEIKPNTNIDSYFLSMSINRSQVYFSKRGAGTKVQNISKPNVENFEFYCPSEREQQKIGSFFKQLDNTIDLHQRKLDLLKEQKKGFLQKMFV
ncbi:restriction endonuclease subunit S [Enterococcus faecalis]|uniref:restriction endonuclease subunit S n=1 Tax=Enterococcus faecalis TaxID=1351 RepID=UPI0036EC7140|nr:restriction endonuclease subunit S [Enterococcus faecalis]